MEPVIKLLMFKELVYEILTNDRCLDVSKSGICNLNNKASY